MALYNFIKSNSFYGGTFYWIRCSYSKVNPNQNERKIDLSFSWLFINNKNIIIYEDNK